MRITRLHILVGLIGLMLVGYGIFSWMQRRTQQISKTASAHVPIVNKQFPGVPTPSLMSKSAAQPVVSAAPEKKEGIARTIATIGEEYRVLPKPSGEIPSIAQPLRLAKDYLASGQLNLAMVCARQAWAALKKIQTSKESIGESYEVVKGDTLWRIARDHSPVHQGPGWVTIWKANKRVVRDFNRIEAGWNLAIPDKPSQYIEPYWRPRQLASARSRQPASLIVDLPEVLAWADQQKKKSAVGSSLYAYLAAQENAGSWAQLASRPSSRRIAAPDQVALTTLEPVHHAAWRTTRPDVWPTGLQISGATAKTQLLVASRIPQYQ